MQDARRVQATVGTNGAADAQVWESSQQRLSRRCSQPKMGNRYFLYPYRRRGQLSVHDPRCRENIRPDGELRLWIQVLGRGTSVKCTGTSVATSGFAGVFLPEVRIYTYPRQNDVLLRNIPTAKGVLKLRQLFKWTPTEPVRYWKTRHRATRYWIFFIYSFNAVLILGLVGFRRHIKVLSLKSSKLVVNSAWNPACMPINQGFFEIINHFNLKTYGMLCAGVWACRVPGGISRLFPSKVVNW